MWTAFTDSQAQVILFHAIGFALACFIVYQGIAGGIEKFCKVAIPALFIILVGLAIYAVTLNGASQGLQYLFTVKKEYILSPNTWIQAFIQAAWSTGAGWGIHYYICELRRRRGRCSDKLSDHGDLVITLEQSSRHW